MPSERNLIHALKKDAQRLIEAMGETQFWYAQQMQLIERSHKKRQAQIEMQAQQELANAQAAYQAVVSAVAKNNQDIIQKTALLSAPWEDTMWQSWSPVAPKAIPHITRIGSFVEHGAWDNLTLPALMPIIGGHNLLFKASGAGKERVRLTIQSIMLRLLATLPPGKVRYTCLDPVGLGSTMAGLIKGLPDILTGGQAWFDTYEIENRLADLEKHIANVKQKYLGHSFANMEEYNAQAGEVAEPYRLLVVSDFPARFSDTAAQRLVSIATNGPGAGVYLLVMVDTEQKHLYNFNLTDLERTATVITCSGDQPAYWDDPDFRACRLLLDRLPHQNLFERITKTIGDLAVSASEVKVPFSKVAPPTDKWWQGDARAGLSVPIGRHGAQETQAFELNEKLLSSGLVIGRTGSGKSSLLHTLITSLALVYSPDELELYLLDFKKVEFKDYAAFSLPHARVIAIQSEREFGLSVLNGLDAELHRRSDLFRDLGFQSLSEYRRKTNIRLPRLLLIADEFQELFSEDDQISSQANMILDRLIRMGRAFGINVLLASQTLAGHNSLSRSTKDQIPVRIALQCADADSRLILSDDNDRARLLERPGEAIYNATNGRVEGNNLFQTFWLPDDEREHYLKQIQEQAKSRNWKPVSPQIVFDGNAPADVRSNQVLLNLLNLPDWPARARSSLAWLGEPVAIKTHTTAIMRRQSGSNLLIVGQNEHEPKAVSMLLTATLSLAAQHRPTEAGFVLFNLSDVDAEWYELPDILAKTLPHPTVVVNRRTVLSVLNKVTSQLRNRAANENDTPLQSLYLIILGLQRQRELRLPENYYPGPGEAKPPAAQLTEIIREGPDFGIHTLLWCDTYSNLERVFDRSPETLFDMRVTLQMNGEDSRRLLDTDLASKLGPHRAIYLDEERSTQPEKFRPYGLPTPEWLAEQGAKLRSR